MIFLLIFIKEVDFINIKITKLFICLTLGILVGCIQDYQVDSIISGTVEEKLVHKEMLVIKEDEAEGTSGSHGSIYEIPVDDIEKYAVGDKLKVTVYSNTDKDVWNINNMKFEIEQIKKKSIKN